MLADLGHVLAVGSHVAQREHQVHVLAAARYVQCHRQRPGDLGVLRHRLGLNRDAEAATTAMCRRQRRARCDAGRGDAAGRIAHRRLLRRQRVHHQALDIGGIMRLPAVEAQVHLLPLRARERPLVLEAEGIRLRAATGADLELHRRLVHDPGVDALQPVVEEAQLVEPALFRMERMKVGSGMDAKLLVH